MGPQNFFGSGLWIIPLVMMLICAFGFRKFMGGNRFFDQNQGNGNSRSEESPLDILKKRYAKGEISRSEFEQMKKDL